MHLLEERPEILFEQEFKRLFELAEIVNLTQKEMRQYDKSLKARLDYENIMQTNIEKGEKRGIVKGEKRGIVKGEKKGVLKVAKNLKENGASIELIVKSTGLTREQVLEL